MQSDNQVFTVQMLGGFSMSWNGKPLRFRGGAGDSQFSQLMQVILHQRHRGRSREELIGILFEGRELDSPAHSLQSLLYSARKKLQAAGLPGTHYLELLDDIYYWTDAIDVAEDAEIFERLCDRAEDTHRTDEKLRLALEAIDIYTGDFLPGSTMTWAAEEAQRLREMYHRTVQLAAELLRREKDYGRLDALGRKAAEAQPCCDWEVLSLEALLAQGRYDAAMELYHFVTRLYLEQVNRPPSSRMLQLLYSSNSPAGSGEGILARINERLAARKDNGEVMLCSFSAFEGIYRISAHLAETRDIPSSLMLCLMENTDGVILPDRAISDAQDTALQHAICSTLAPSDVVMRTARGHYLVLLAGITPELSGTVQSAISAKFAGNGTLVRFYCRRV